MKLSLNNASECFERRRGESICSRGLERDAAKIDATRC